MRPHSSLPRPPPATTPARLCAPFAHWFLCFFYAINTANAGLASGGGKGSRGRETRSELVNCSRESLKSFAQIVAQICNFRIKFDSNYLSVEDASRGSRRRGIKRGAGGESNNQSCWKVKSTKYLAKVAGLCDKCGTNTSKSGESSCLPRVARVADGKKVAGKWQLAMKKRITITAHCGIYEESKANFTWCCSPP